MVRYSKIFYPDSKNAKIYEDLFSRVYKKIYPRLSKVYEEIQKITGVSRDILKEG
jgi:predicted nucleotide-binding protein (sugar kinase/HSP70/actin superfamily)